MLIWYDVEAWHRIGQSDKNKSKKKPSALWTRGTVEKCLKKKKLALNNFSKYNFSRSTKMPRKI